jgi:hypothetical protein
MDGFFPSRKQFNRFCWNYIFCMHYCAHKILILLVMLHCVFCWSAMYECILDRAQRTPFGILCRIATLWSLPFSVLFIFLNFATILAEASVLWGGGGGLGLAQKSNLRVLPFDFSQSNYNCKYQFCSLCIISISYPSIPVYQCPFFFVVFCCNCICLVTN